MFAVLSTGAMLLAAAVLLALAAMLVRCTEVRVPMAVAHFVAAEMLFVPWLVVVRVEVLAARRIFAVPSIVAIVMVIHVAPEIEKPVKPWSRTDKHAA